MNSTEHELYKKIILDHSRNPYHFLEFKDLKDSKNIDTIKADNLDCGDSYNIYIRTNNKKIEELFFYGQGCALSKASSSILCKNIEDKSVEEAYKIITSFLEDMEILDSSYSIRYENFRIFSDFRLSSRKECVIFVFKEMKKYLGSFV